jgi:hypothetical protein
MHLPLWQNIAVASKQANLTAKSAMTARVFADTNLFIYAESQDQDKSSRAIEIIQDAPVISIPQVVGLLYRLPSFIDYTN